MKRNLAAKARLDKIMADTKRLKQREESIIHEREYTVTYPEEKKQEKRKEDEESTSKGCDQTCAENLTPDSIEEQNTIESDQDSSLDFSSGSSEDYIPNSDPDTSTDSSCKQKLVKRNIYLKKKIVPQSSDSTDSESDSSVKNKFSKEVHHKSLPNVLEVKPSDDTGESSGNESFSLLVQNSDNLLVEPESDSNGNTKATGNHPEELTEDNQQATDLPEESQNEKEPTDPTNTNQEQTSPVKKKDRKLRKSLKERRKDRIARLILRNAGKTYVTKLGKIQPGRNLAPLKDCRMKCKDRISHEVREHIFKEYWNLGSYNERAKYIEKLIKIQKKKTAKSESKRQRDFNNKFKLIHFTDEFPVCKGCFLKTIGESSRFVQTICEKIKKYGRLTNSERGRAASYKKVSDCRLKEIEEHILQFPAYESHYSRAKSSKKYLSPDLSIETMYSMYTMENDNPVSKTVYAKVFRDLNLSFKKPSIDTCNKCNILNNKLKYVTVDEEKNDINAQLTQHLEMCNMAYDEKRKDKELAKTSEDTVVIAFDLQQCLPTPMLHTQTAFYKRQLWVFNLTVHDFLTNNAYCYMWPESSGGRGANQIASCLYDFIVTRLPMLYPEAKHLIMYSDSCSGQNKNTIVTTALMLAVKDSEKLLTIQHKFLIPGHTHMEVDSDHALIERAKKRTSMNIHHPRDWCQLVRSASKRNNKFSVIEMSENDFYNFAQFSKQCLLLKKINSRGDKFVWSDVRVMKFDKHQFPKFAYKTSFKDDEYQSMSYAKRNKNYDLVSLNAINKCYDGPVPISDKKKEI